MRFRVLGIGFREGRGEGVLPVQQTGRGEGVLPVQQHYPCFCKEELMRTYVHIHYIYIYVSMYVPLCIYTPKIVHM